MSNLYFLSTYLPSLSLTEPHQLSLEDLEFTLEQNLSVKELKILDQIWYAGDVENVRSYFHDEPMNRKGSIDIEDMATLLTWDEKKPLWLETFMTDFPTEQERAKNSYLLSRYCLLYAPHEALHESIKEILSIDSISRSLFQFLRGGLREDTQIPFLKEPLQEWPYEYQQLALLWEKFKDEPLKLEQHLAEWRFQLLEERRSQCSPFSLSYLIFSISLFEFIESRRPLIENIASKSHERIVKALKNNDSNG